jgi:histidinol-phosphate/aromatic aminotransferase/cobyric acid decarboxylase-like protein
MIAHGALDHAELAAKGIDPAELLDFSSNINPFGPPRSVLAALAQLDPAPYPDRSCLRLRAALAAHHACAPEAILLGNGSNELIHLLARALLVPGDCVLTVDPTFGEYAHASALAGAELHSWRAAPQDGFALDMGAIAAAIHARRPRLVWICAPANPTGVAPTDTDLALLGDVCAGVGALLVVDRAYTDLVRDLDPIGEPREKLPPHTLVLHSLTKSYALAGLRLGYLRGEPGLVARVGRLQPTWSVNSAAQAAGIAALADTSFLPTTLPRLWEASDALLAGLRDLGLRVERRALPFVLVRSGDGARTRAELLARGCLVRDCGSFGMAGYVRVAPQRPEQNARLIDAWKELL